MASRRLFTVGSNSSLLLVPGQEGSPMTSLDAETDLKPIIIIIIIVQPQLFTTNASAAAFNNLIVEI